MVRLPKDLQNQELFLMHLGDNVKKYRLKAGLSQQALADAVGISHPRISEIECGRGNPTVRTLREIADFLEVDLQKFFKTAKKKIRSSVKQGVVR